MRILFCNYEYPPLGGGGGVVNALLAQELATRHDVTVLTSQGLGLPRESVEGGVRIMRAPVFFRTQQATAGLASLAAFIPMGIRTGRRLLRTARYDLINTHFALPSGPVGDALARAGRVPHVLSVHGGDLYDPSKTTSPHRHPLLRSWIRRLAGRADAVVAQSRNTAENLRRFYAPTLAATQIPLGIRRPPAGAASRAAFGIRDDEVVLVTVGRLVARKAMHQLLALMQRLRDEPVRLLILGSGPEEEPLRREAQERQVAPRVRFFGHVPYPEKFRVLRMADVFVSTSQHEGFGLVFLEAMACGLPVVCYDHGGQTDVLEDGRTGSLAALNDLQGVARGCRRLINQPALRQEIGAANERRVEAFFIERCAARYEELFQQLVAARHPGPGSWQPQPDVAQVPA